MVSMGGADVHVAFLGKKAPYSSISMQPPFKILDDTEADLRLL